MGAWGTAIFSDDFAADVKREYQTLLAFGTPPMEAYSLVKNHFTKDLEEDDTDYHTFYFAIASIQRKYGLLTQEVKDIALKIIDSGESMEIWEESADKKEIVKRKSVLEKLKTDLLSPPLPQRKVPKLWTEKHRWDVGDIVACKIITPEVIEKWYYNKYFLFRVFELQRNGLSQLKPDLVYDEWPKAILFDWVDDEMPDQETVKQLSYYDSTRKYGIERCVCAANLLWQPKFFKLSLVRHDKEFVMPNDINIRWKQGFLSELSDIQHFREIYKNVTTGTFTAVTP